VEGLAVVMLCSSKPIIRKQAVIMLKETRNLFTILNVPKVATLSRLALLPTSTRMWASAQRDGRPAEHRWRPLHHPQRTQGSNHPSSLFYLVSVCM